MCTWLQIRARLDDNTKLLEFTEKLEAACVGTVESGKMTKDIALIIHGSWLSHFMNTENFIDVVVDELKARLASKLKKLKKFGRSLKPTMSSASATVLAQVAQARIDPPSVSRMVSVEIQPGNHQPFLHVQENIAFVGSFGALSSSFDAVVV
ncbi:unnamed protein product [Arabidopsis lyrata]|nr:unnamed protein product [Arabidopsis lyrata]